MIQPNEITVGEFNARRERLISLYNLISYKGFDVLVAPINMYTLEQLENREVVITTDNPDERWLGRPAVYTLTVPDMVPVIPNLSSPDMMCFINPKRDSVLLYESIQEYLRLWVLMMTEHTWIMPPPMEELYTIQSVAEWAFTSYYAVNIDKLYDKNKELENVSTSSFIGLGNLLLSSSRSNSKPEELSFYSHLDNFRAGVQKTIQYNWR